MKYSGKYRVSKASRKYNKLRSYIYFRKNRWDGSVGSLAERSKCPISKPYEQMTHAGERIQADVKVVPRKYDIPDGSESVAAEKGGEVYYSHPNRIILFYHDAEVTGEYTKIGAIEYTDAFVKAVEENPVLDGRGNKIVSVSSER